MGDVAIKAVNQIARWAGQAASFRPVRRISCVGSLTISRTTRPALLPASRAQFLHRKVKRKMIAEDIATALSLVK